MEVMNEASKRYSITVLLLVVVILAGLFKLHFKLFPQITLESPLDAALFLLFTGSHLAADRTHPTKHC